MEKFVESEVFKKLNVAFVLDEGLPTEEESFKCIMRKDVHGIVISCKGEAGHGSQLIENTASEKLGGVQMNVLPTEIKVWFDLRVPPTHNFEELENQISKWCTDAGSDVTYSFIKELSDISEHLSGSTDSRFLRQKGIRSIGFSPINKTPILLHAHNEYITEECFLNGVIIYEKLIEKLANLPE
uniref:M20_dimer domain-containing protein n=1 Tax=Loa loa TaxID=7209 RepID=A0A1I7VBY9_LOALO